MSIDQQVMEVLRRHAPGLISEPPENVVERRRELRERLAGIDSNDLADVRACEAKVQAVEKRQAELKAQQEIAEKEFADARWELSQARATYSEHRDAAWKELDTMPCEALKVFRHEVEGRLTDLASWSRTWPGKVDQQIGRQVQTGNSASLDAYAQALLHTKGGIDDAIHKGLDGKEADSAIEAMRARWPRVQVARDEYVTPTWHG